MFRSPLSCGSTSHHQRWVMWIGVWTLLLSLSMPLLSLHAAGAVESLPQRMSQGVPPDCEAGFVTSEDGTACIEDSGIEPGAVKYICKHHGLQGMMGQLVVT